MKYNIDEKDDQIGVSIDSQMVDFDSVDSLKKLFDLLFEKQKSVQLNLALVMVITSIGLGMILVFKKKLEKNNLSLEIVEISEGLRNIFYLSGVGNIFNI